MIKVETDLSRSKDNYWYINPADNRFEIWSVILIEDHKIAACSAIQKFHNCARILTRFSINPSYRTKGMQKKFGMETYAFSMVKEQIDYCKKKSYSHAFFSTERNRKGIVKRHCRMAKELGLICEPLSGLYNVCRLINNKELNQSHSCWQNIGLYKLSKERFPLVKLPVNS